MNGLVLHLRADVDVRQRFETHSRWMFIEVILVTHLAVLLQVVMTPNHSSSQDPVFQTPQPSQLQSEEDQASVRERLAKQQGSETDVVDKRGAENDTEPTDAVDVLENMDELENRHLPSIDSPPG